MELYPLLNIQKGVAAVIGSGGKSTLLHTLAQELTGRVLLCTSTHFQPYADLPTVTNPTPDSLRQAFSQHAAVCAGRINAENKLTDCGLSYAELADIADYVLVEADGSRRLPLKAHACYEPVIPPESRQVICVVGLSGLHRRVCEAVHRPELFCALTGCAPTDEVTAELIAAGLLREYLADTFLLNQADNAAALQNAQSIARLLKNAGLRVIIGSQKRREYHVF